MIGGAASELRMARTTVDHDRCFAEPVELLDWTDEGELSPSGQDVTALNLFGDVPSGVIGVIGRVGPNSPWLLLIFPCEDDNCDILEAD